MIRSLFTAASLILSLSSHAVTITFDDIQPVNYEDPIPYVEAGITFNAPGGSLGYDGTPGTIHLDDFGTSNASTVIVTTGSKFTPEALKVGGYAVTFSYELLDPNAPDEETIVGSVYVEGVLVRGFRGNTLVTEDRFSVIEQPNYVFNSAFSKIDALEIVADVDVEAVEAMIQGQYLDHVITRLECDLDAPCSHFNIDSITINTSPKKPQCPRIKKAKKPLKKIK